MADKSNTLSRTTGTLTATAQGATASIASQLTSVALQGGRFSWSEVAVNAIGAGAGYLASGQVLPKDGGNRISTADQQKNDTEAMAQTLGDMIAKTQDKQTSISGPHTMLADASGKVKIPVQPPEPIQVLPEIEVKASRLPNIREEVIANANRMLYQDSLRVLTQDGRIDRNKPAPVVSANAINTRHELRTWNVARDRATAIQLEQTRRKFGAVLAAPIAISANSLTIIGGGVPSIGGMLTGGTTSGIVNYEAQKILNPDGKVNWIDLVGNTLAGMLTFGKGFTPSVMINSQAALMTSGLQDQYPNAKLAGAILGTGAGNFLGNQVVRNGNAAAIAAAINGNVTIANSIAGSVQPFAATGASVTQEYVGNQTEKWLNRK